MWMKRDISLHTELTEYDDRLVAVWSDHHGPIIDDTRDSSESDCRKAGRDLLDWSHHEAPTEVGPVRREWREAFYIQGMYQQLADEKKVGWHPSYIELLNRVRTEDKTN